jgi:hypothetical protein
MQNTGSQRNKNFLFAVIFLILPDLFFRFNVKDLLQVYRQPIQNNPEQELQNSDVTSSQFGLFTHIALNVVALIAVLSIVYVVSKKLWQKFSNNNPLAEDFDSATSLTPDELYQMENWELNDPHRGNTNNGPKTGFAPIIDSATRRLMDASPSSTSASSGEVSRPRAVPILTGHYTPTTTRASSGSISSSVSSGQSVFKPIQSPNHSPFGAGTPPKYVPPKI